MNSIPEIIADIRAGKMIILMDDEDRENEGDLVMAATHTRAQDINFMATEARGLICLALTQARCQQLDLPLMVQRNLSNHGTNFTVSIDATNGISTGISAADRACTIQTAAAAQAHPQDIVQPGHVFPLMAQNGGVLTRAGHTEAGCDLARLAGLEPAATIVEILKPDGSMARYDDLKTFAEQHDLKIGTIENLIRYQIRNQRTVKKIDTSRILTQYGEFDLHAYQDVIEQTVHLALVVGEPDMTKPVPVRVHLENTLIDTLGALDSGRWSLGHALHKIIEFGGGVLIILRKIETPESFIESIHQHTHREETNPQASARQSLRTYGIGAQILLDLGVRDMQLLSSPKTMHGLAGFGLRVSEYVAD